MKIILFFPQFYPLSILVFIWQRLSLPPVRPSPPQGSCESFRIPGERLIDHQIKQSWWERSNLSGSSEPRTWGECTDLPQGLDRTSSPKGPEWGDEIPWGQLDCGFMQKGSHSLDPTPSKDGPEQWLRPLIPQVLRAEILALGTVDGTLGIHKLGWRNTDIFHLTELWRRCTISSCYEHRHNQPRKSC